MQLCLKTLLTSCIAASVLLISSMPASAAISVFDDAHRRVTIASPAHRIVSLAPHATELLFTAGAGAYIVGVSEYSDYPAEAKRIASVGGNAALDLERIVSLKPDLIVVWGSGNSATQIAKLRALQIPIFESEPRDYATVATSIERLAQLAGTASVGNVVAQTFRLRLKTLTSIYRNRPPVRVFYQIWREPLMTLNDAHMVSAALRLCGAENIFGTLPQLVPTVSIEAVLQENPEVILASASKDNDGQKQWRRFPKMIAVARGNLFHVNVDSMTRAGPRILDGTELLCQQIDTARHKRSRYTE